MSAVLTKVESELKAGHPPAVKIGGMRITQHKLATDKLTEPKVEANDGDKEELPVEAHKPPPKVVQSVSGTIARDNQDFPASSVKAFHEKTPKPTNEFRPVHKNHAIQQPKKF